MNEPKERTMKVGIIPNKFGQEVLEDYTFFCCEGLKYASRYNLICNLRKNHGAVHYKGNLDFLGIIIDGKYEQNKYVLPLNICPCCGAEIKPYNIESLMIKNGIYPVTQNRIDDMEIGIVFPVYAAYGELNMETSYEWNFFSKKENGVLELTSADYVTTSYSNFEMMEERVILFASRDFF